MFSLKFKQVIYTVSGQPSLHVLKKVSLHCQISVLWIQQVLTICIDFQVGYVLQISLLNHHTWFLTKALKASHILKRMVSCTLLHADLGNVDLSELSYRTLTVDVCLLVRRGSEHRNARSVSALALFLKQILVLLCCSPQHLCQSCCCVWWSLASSWPALCLRAALLSFWKTACRFTGSKHPAGWLNCQSRMGLWLPTHGSFWTAWVCTGCWSLTQIPLWDAWGPTLQTIPCGGCLCSWGGCWLQVRWKQRK